ncbi:MAG: twin-arginine translocase TatA/TatE family subunit [Bdellovibrionales bacterium]|nr:twin-arginine translocase TatA/TatE family subunit [Bdellovibrionales bacterium]
MFGLSLGHLLILTLVVLLFGYRRLPELGSALGQAISSFKKGLEQKETDHQIADKSAADRNKDDHNPRA